MHIIIPARLASQRLPNKILIKVAGKPLIQHVYERALLCGAQSVVIAVDDERVKTIAESFGAVAYMTATAHTTGSDRIAEVVQKNAIPDDEIVVNFQGDEPLLPPMAVTKVVNALKEYPDAAMATLCTPIRQREEILDQNCVKVVFDRNQFALYFSRAAIPYDREAAFEINKKVYYRHIGVYAYRASALKKYYSQCNGQLSCPLEDLEKLEQLRILWQGAKIHVSILDQPLPPGIDTSADLEKFKSILNKAGI